MRFLKQTAALVLVFGTVIWAAGAYAQSGVGDVVYVPTPQIVVDEMLSMAKVKQADYLIDLGSGDGRLVITAAKKYGARALGVDLDTHLLKVANDNALKANVADRVTFREQNLFETDLGEATVISTYLLPEMNLKLRSKILGLRPGTRVVAHDYNMGEWYPDEQKTLVVPEKKVGTAGVSYLYAWVVPALMAGKWRATVNVNGKAAAYEFEVMQSFQHIDGSVIAGGSSGEMRGKVSGDQIRLVVSGKPGANPQRHVFQGKLTGETLSGTVRIGFDTTAHAWKAERMTRGELKRAQDEPETK